jgi:hypothetical protein
MQPPGHNSHQIHDARSQETFKTRSFGCNLETAIKEVEFKGFEYFTSASAIRDFISESDIQRTHIE